jgi:hypothetical protein
MYGLATGWTAVVSSKGKIFLFSIASKPVLGLTQPFIQWVSGVLSKGVKLSGREVDTYLRLVSRSRMVEL